MDLFCVGKPVMSCRLQFLFVGKVVIVCQSVFLTVGGVVATCQRAVWTLFPTQKSPKLLKTIALGNLYVRLIVIPTKLGFFYNKYKSSLIYFIFVGNF